ncbi:hypothetical protein [Siphonobacter sp. SORGH_AS_1065]|uniref:hypothetical protein n=1 Tax=Siphonobacter sp. SORGH_AS_1065 TaxID=3041795 RepID=UPI00278A32DC|nr:hypothetical protein [Siphonobacter sp. SORGH_AS_1065]MDQ1088594.1 hypothetical protein [Siphonobacter sp. SORGH_AS_1065]
MKKKLLVSFSGGETSAFMAQYCQKHLSDEYDIIYVFANTGEETWDEANVGKVNTLEFVNLVDKHFDLGVIWVEALIHPEHNKGTTHKVVDFESASRDGEPFKSMIQKYGIPNKLFPHCTRELKLKAIRSYAKSLGWKDYYTAIGIRADEIDRISENKDKEKLIYPLVKLGTTKPIINLFWREMPFRLELAGYEDNCKVCFKKTLRKHLTLAKLKPERFENFKKWEAEFENHIPVSQLKRRIAPIRFFRGNLSVDEIMELASKGGFQEYPDDRTVYPEFSNEVLDVTNGCSESCEVF